MATVPQTVRRELIESINRVNDTTIGTSAIEFSDVAATTGTRNTTIKGRGVTEFVTGEQTFRYNRINLSALNGLISTNIKARPIKRISDALDEINRNTKLELRLEDIVDSTVDLNGDSGESFTLQCAASSPRYTGSLKFTLKPSATYMLRGEVSIVKDRVYSLRSTNSNVVYTEALYSTLIIGGVEHSIDSEGKFSSGLETGVYEFFYATPLLGLFGRQVPVTKINRIMNYGSTGMSLDSYFINTASLLEVGNDWLKGNTQRVSLTSTFAGCRSLVKVGSGFLNFTGGVSAFDNTFMSCSGLIEFGETEVPVSEQPYVTAAGLLSGCTNLTKIPTNLLRKAKNCTTFTNTFSTVGRASTDGCVVPAGLLDDCIAGSNISNMFYNFKAVSWPNSLLKNMGKVINANGTFWYANLSYIHTGFMGPSTTILNAQQALAGSSEFIVVEQEIFAPGNSVDATGLFTGSRITSMSKDVFLGIKIRVASSMFSSANILGVMPNIFDSQSDITTLSRIFYGATLEFDASNDDIFKDLINVTAINEMCYNTRLRTAYFPKRLFTTMTKINVVFSAFRGLTGTGDRVIIPVGLFVNQSLAKDFTTVFTGATNIHFDGSILPAAGSATNLYNTFGTVETDAYPSDLLKYGQNVTDASRCFNGYTPSVIPVGLLDPLTGCLKMQYLFFGAVNITTAPSSLFAKNVLVTDLSDGFNGLKKAFVIPAGLYDPLVNLLNVSGLYRTSVRVTVPKGLLAKNSKLTNIGALFTSAAIDGTLEDLLPVDIDPTTPMSGAFNGCTLNNVTLAGVRGNIPLDGTSSTMFGNAKNRQTSVADMITFISPSPTNRITSATKANLMFLNCTWIVGSKDDFVKALWQVSDASMVSDNDKNVVLNGCTGLI